MEDTKMYRIEHSHAVSRRDTDIMVLNRDFLMQGSYFSSEHHQPKDDRDEEEGSVVS